MRKLSSRLTVWIFLLPSFLLSAIAYTFFPKKLKQPFFQPTHWLLDLRKNYMSPVKLSPPKQLNLPEKPDLAYVDKLGHNEFEDFVAELLKTRGYAQVKVTQASGDFGVDVIAHKNEMKYGIQVKHYSGNVRFKAVQEVVTGIQFHECQVAMVVTNSYFTNQAKEGARKVACELIDRDTLKCWLEEYQWAESSDFFDQLRLKSRQHRVLIISLISLVLLILVYLTLFTDPICNILC